MTIDAFPPSGHTCRNKLFSFPFLQSWTSVIIRKDMVGELSLKIVHLVDLHLVSESKKTYTIAGVWVERDVDEKENVKICAAATKGGVNAVDRRALGRHFCLSASPLSAAQTTLCSFVPKRSFGIFGSGCNWVRPCWENLVDEDANSILSMDANREMW